MQLDKKLIGHTFKPFTTTVEAVREAGGEVIGVAVIVDRSTGAQELIEATGVPYRFAAGLADLDLL